ncbi:MAG: hypothetical protein AMJ53_13630 [Gammaproteobacteria bacterium SG8_11]|nr:MAG: hypothetical protein AMJ53_13630 [Gammaproteobacteria bacterium SG8_11]
MLIYDRNQDRWISLRETAQYRQKRKIVRDAWIIVGIIMCTLPLAGICVMALLTTFLSLSFLDESQYQFD